MVVGALALGLLRTFALLLGLFLLLLCTLAATDYRNREEHPPPEWHRAVTALFAVALVLVWAGAARC